ncbi:MAG: outer membrane protein assembly factor BamD [Pseudomonadota bacterium]
MDSNRMTLNASRLWLLVVLAVLLAVSGCKGRDAQSRLTRLTPEALYQRATKSMRNDDYGDAIRVYEALTARYPFTDQARQSRLDLIYAYYKNREKESALDAADTFIRENPAHPRIDYAWYLKGLVEFERTPHVVERWLRVDLSQRPPTTARASFQAFRTVVERFPKSAYAADSRRRMIYLRNRLAGYELQVARYYIQRQAWVAAAQRASQSIEQYDGAPSTREALEILIQCYRQLGYTELVANSERVYRENFPEATGVIAPKHKWWKVWDRG